MDTFTAEELEQLRFALTAYLAHLEEGMRKKAQDGIPLLPIEKQHLNAVAHLRGKVLTPQKALRKGISNAAS